MAKNDSYNAHHGWILWVDRIVATYYLLQACNGPVGPNMSPKMPLEILVVLTVGSNKSSLLAVVVGFFTIKWYQEGPTRKINLIGSNRRVSKPKNITISPPKIDPQHGNNAKRNRTKDTLENKISTQLAFK